MFRKNLLVIGLATILGLTGCFGGGDEEGSNQEIAGSKRIYETDNFALAVPLEWEVVEPEQFTSNVPSGTAVVFVNDVKSDRFTANLNVLRTNFTEENINRGDFAISSVEQARSTLTSFSEGNIEEIEISFGEESIPGYISTFSGKRNATDPVIQWRQMTTIANGTGYTVSAAYISDENENVVKQLNEMLNSFALK